MRLPSLRELVMATPRPLRKFVRYRMLPSVLSQRLGSVVDNGRVPLFTKGAVDKVKGPVRPLIHRLWGGFSEQAIIELELVKRSPRSRTDDAARAARALGSWYASHGDFERAYGHVVFARVARPSLAKNTHHLLLESDCLFDLRRPEEARELVEPYLEKLPTNCCLKLTMANSFAYDDGPISDEDEERRLEWINSVFISNELAPIDKIDASLPLSLENIFCPDTKPVSGEEIQPKISVIVPAYAAADTLHIALNSLLRQTWTNLEILVVDDVSPDETLRVARRFAERDNRIVVLEQTKNSGAYAARNLALRHATGEFVTIHDADDWSHPQKLELQVRDLMISPDRVANLTDWVRCYSHLFFRGSARIGTSRVIMNHSALMLRRSTALALGGWDEVRIAADSEFIRRLERWADIDSIPRLHRGVPLAFALELASSLTRQSVTHVFTLTHGVRQTYHDAARHWLETRGEAHHWKLPPPEEGRPFPAPALITRGREELPVFDLLVVMDYALAGGAFVSTLNYLKAAANAGKRVAVLQWRRYDQSANYRMSREVLELAQKGAVYRVSPGEELKAKTVLVGYPVILQFSIDLVPKVECERFGIITNQMSSRLYSGGDVQYDPTMISEKMESMFGRKPFWIPISDLVRKLMIEDGRYSPIHSATWTPLIDTATWCAEQVEYRGKTRRRPVVGRHARDHYTKWPTSPEAIVQAYCVDAPCDVKLLGGAAVPIGILDREPKNWTVHAYGSLDAREFLLDLDFFVHYPHEDYIEEFGRAVLEAMAAGVPVILPPVFKPTFGAAALYSPPSEVWNTIDALWADEGAWRKRVDAGNQFIRENNDWGQIASRLSGLETSAPSE